jgi:hypothetical protein
MEMEMDAAWSKVESCLSTAKAITWDTCHKIYVLMDDKEVETMVEYGYEPIIRSNESTPNEMLSTLMCWYNESCALRFINAVGDREFTDLIPQGYGQEEW